MNERVAILLRVVARFFVLYKRECHLYFYQKHAAIQ